MRRVVVTGLGLLTSIGQNVKDSWDNLISCKSGIKKITKFDTSELSCKIAGHISTDSDDDFFVDLQNIFEPKVLKRNDRFIVYGLLAAKEAIEDSGINHLTEEQKIRTGISVGSGIGGLETIYDGSITLTTKGPRRISPFFIPASLINLLSGQI